MWNWRLNRRPLDAGSQNDNVDLAIAHAVDSILSGRCSPGDKIKEADLAKGTGLGVGYAREALQLMTGAKILERQQNHGYRVRQLDGPQLAGYLDTLEITLTLALELIRDDQWAKQQDGALMNMLHARALAKPTRDETLLHNLFEIFDVLVEKSGSRYLPHVYVSLCPVLLAIYLMSALPEDDRRGALARIDDMTRELLLHLEHRDAEKSLASLKYILSTLRLWLRRRYPFQSVGF